MRYYNKKSKKIILSLFLIGMIIGNGVSLASAASMERANANQSEETIIQYTKESARAKGIRIANPAKVLWVGDTYRFTLVANKMKDANVSWSSSNPEIASIDSDTGEMNLLREGHTTISVMNQETGRSAKTSVTVKKEPDPEVIPEEWCTVRMNEEMGTWVLVLKDEYQEEYLKYEAITLPSIVEGKECSEVADLEVFKNLKILKFPAKMRISGLKRFRSLEKIILPMECDELCWDRLGEIKEQYIGLSYMENLSEIHIPTDTKVLFTSDYNGCKKLTEFVFPKNISELYLQNYDDLETYKFPKEKIYEGGGFRQISSMQGYQVDGNNPTLYSRDGVLFEEEEQGMVLHRYPVAKTQQSYLPPSEVKRINEFAFAGAKKLKKITIPEGTKSIGTYAFYQCKNLKELVIPASVKEFGRFNPEDFRSTFQTESFEKEAEEEFEGINDPKIPIMDNATKKNVTILTPKGSAAEKYAKAHGIKYKNIK